MMKRKLSFLMAALMLLSFLAHPFWTMGQNTFEKVTSTPNDWSGEYLLVYEADSAYYWTGVDVAYCYETATIENGIISANPAVTLMIESMDDGGYSIMVNGGTNNGKYISGVNGSNTISFGDTPTINSLEYDNGVVITSNTSVMRYNYASNQKRFRYYKSSSYAAQQPVQLYKRSGGSATPTVATPTFTPNGGTFFPIVEVVISCATEGATIHYTTDGTTPNANSNTYSAPLNIYETTTVKAIAMKTGMNNSAVATATFTLGQQGNTITNIPDLWEFATSVGTNATSVSVTFNDWYVTGVKGGQAIISDGQYGFVIYQSGHGFTAGDKLNGTVSCNALLYQNHYAELTGIHASDLTVTPGQEMPMLSTTIGELEVRNYGTPIDLGTLTYNGSQFADEDGNTITPYNNFNLSPNPVTSLENGKQYNVKGVSIIYWNNSGQTQQIAPRTADDFEEVSSPTGTVATPQFIPGGGNYTEAVEVTIECETQGATIYYTLDGTDPVMSATGGNATQYTSPLSISENTTVKAIGVKEGMTNSAIATAEYTFNSGSTLITIAEARALANDQYALVQGVITFIDGKNVYIQDETAGIDLFLNSAVSTLNLGDLVQAYGKRSVYKGLVELSDIDPTDQAEFSVISTGNQLPLAEQSIAYILDDAAGPNTLQSTRVKIVDATVGTINTSNNTPITQDGSTLNIYKIPTVQGLEEGDVITVIGIIGCFNNPQLRVASADDITVNGQQTETVATPTFTPAAGTYTEAQTVTINCATQGAYIFYTTDGYDPTPNSALYESPITISETTTVKAIAMKDGMNDSQIASALYTISNTPQNATEYSLITSTNALIPGDKYIIVGIKSDAYKALGRQNTNNRVAVDVTPSNNVISLIPAAVATDTTAFELTLGQDGDNWTLFDAVNGGYLYAASSSANYLKLQTENDANGQWTIEIASDGVATIIAQGENTRNWLRLNNNGSPFSCYASGQLDVYLYKAGDAPTPPTPTYYTASVAEGIANGTVTVNPTSAQEGDIIHVTATPAGGFELATLTYNVTGAAPVDIDQTTMQFAMPAANVTVNATFSSIQPITIAEARALATNQYARVQGVVTFIDGRNVYIQDETAGIDLYMNNNTVPANLAIGDMVTAYGQIANFKGLVELSGINGNNANEFSIVSNGNDLPLAVKTILEIMDDFQTGANMLQSTRVQIVDATLGAINNNNNTPITQDGSTMNIYKLPVIDDLMEGDLVTVIGVIGCYNNPQLRVNSADDVEFTHPIYPILSANPNTLTALNYLYEEGPSEIKTFMLSGNNLEGGVHVYPSENFEISSAGGEYFVPESCININGASHFNNLPIYVRLKAGLEVGNYQETIQASSENAQTISISVSGSVTNAQPPQPPQPSSDYVRLSDISQLGNGSKVIFAARFDDNATDYYAMTAQTSGKPEGVLFSSVVDTDETLPSSIVDEEDNFYWTVATDGTNYTFTNANGDMLGYTSSTNFSTGGENVNWTIAFATSEASAMVPNYSGFVVTNANITNRAFALNGNHNYGPYHTQNMGGENYNFFLDMFATAGSGGTPTCATPTFSPEGGTYYEVQYVTINCSTSDATIYYTLDGSDPTPNSLEYIDPITVDANTTIKAIAMKEGFNDSNIATAEYTIILGAATIFFQDWEGDMNGWTFVSVIGEKYWTINEHSNNHYAYANGYNGGVNEQWCISPDFNLDNYSDVTLSFLNAKNYTGPDVQVFFSNDYDGEDPTEATWTELEFVKSTGSWAWTESGSISLDGFAGTNCYIGFKYTSTEDQAAAWEIDDIALVGFTSDPYLTVTPTSLSGFTHIVGEGPSASQTFVISGGNLPEDPNGLSGVTISCNNSYYEMSLDNVDYYPYLGISVVGTLEPTTIYVRLNGEEVGTYEGTITIEDQANATVSLSGSVTEPPVPGNDWNRIGSLADLHNGDQVIIASRYDATIGNGYYAMTAGVSGKPDGVLFTSVNNNGVETLPAEITDEADTYLWNVTVDGDVITLTNVDGDALGYSSSTNFAGNTSIEWTIAFETAGENAMVPNYTGFLITNAETTNRCIVMNANNKFGAYHTNNINSPDYNFYLDLFVQGGSSTPTVATPVFSMASGTYYEEIDVEISCTTEGAVIYYTTDGSDPTTASDIYSDAIHVDQDMTLKAFATKEGFDDSGIATANYVINTGLVVILNQDWEGEMDGWTFVTVEGNKPWSIGTYGGNKYAYANGYSDDVDNEQWCISPAFNLDNYAGQNVVLTFRNATKFDGPALELYFADDYDGQDPTSASWQPLSYIQSEGNYVWTESGEISMNAFSGTACNIGFKYISTASKSAAAWEIDDIMMTADMNDDPYLSVTPNALSGFEYIVDNGPSDAQTFVLTGGNLPPAPGGETGSVTLTVNHHFEISLDGVTFTNNSLTIPDVVGTLAPTTVYVRLNGLMLGHYEGVVTIEDFVETTVALSGDVVFDADVNEMLAENVKVWNRDNEIMIENNSGNTVNMVVYNILGQPVMSKSIATGSMILSHHLMSGMYVVTLSNNQGTVSTKIVVR